MSAARHSRAGASRCQGCRSRLLRERNAHVRRAAATAIESQASTRRATRKMRVIRINSPLDGWAHASLVHFAQMLLDGGQLAVAAKDAGRWASLTTSQSCV